jgi:pentapeptide repeat protein
VDEEKRISGKPPASSRWIIVIAVIAVGGALAGIFWPWLRDILGDKDRGAIVGALLAGSGLMISVWAAQQRSSYELRFTAQEERERRSLEDEKDRKLRLEQEQKDQRQHSATQRLELSRKLTTAIPHIGDSNPLIQAAGIVELLFQIDDWYALTASEMENEELDVKIEELKEEGRRRRQEIFNLIYNSQTNFPEVLNARVVGLIERLKDDASIRSLDDLDMSNLQLGRILVSSENDREPKYFSANFSGLSFSKGGKIRISGDLAGANFSHTNLLKISFEKSDLSGSNFSYSKLAKINFLESKLNASTFRKATMSACCLDEAVLLGVNFKHAYLDNTSFVRADFRGVDLSNVSINDADLSFAQLAYVTGSEVDMKNANLSFANLDNAKFVCADLSGSFLGFTSLNEATFKNSILNFAFLWRAKLGCFGMRHSYAKNTAFIDVNAEGVRFEVSDVRGSNFSFSNLRNSKFIKTNVGGAVFLKSDLSCVDFKTAIIGDAVFDGAYLGGGDFSTKKWSFNWDEMVPDSSWLNAKYSDSTQFPVQSDANGAIFDVKESGMVRWSIYQWMQWEYQLDMQSLASDIEVSDLIVNFIKGKESLEAKMRKCVASFLLDYLNLSYQDIA